ncbi:uncharacterized protein B0H64DRAFT_369453 [Chaetomium fimeti]|uniref:Secreted protein n=1 Tax=Chaetomium fimeti TaxID=1854472 RepID=A0AAE0HQZ8_9PEZI|nr:hypothetical protein B0H64DRAFT_369453 [Chaetomium fimeti]
MSSPWFRLRLALLIVPCNHDSSSSYSVHGVASNAQTNTVPREWIHVVGDPLCERRGYSKPLAVVGLGDRVGEVKQKRRRRQGEGKAKTRQRRGKDKARETGKRPVHAHALEVLTA